MAVMRQASFSFYVTFDCSCIKCYFILMRWLILLMTLPPAPSRNRVGIWRRLRRAGAVMLKGSAWVLPENSQTTELMHWLMQEIVALKGDAALLRTDRIEMLPQRDPVVLFHEARGAEYAALQRACEALAKELTHPLAVRREMLPQARTRLAKLKRELDAIQRIDYLGAPAGAAALRAYNTAAARLNTLEASMKPRKVRQAGGLPPPGSTWVTRPRPHIDRLASAWLITRFHDKDARFAFAANPAAVKGGVPFDTLGAEFGHHGEDCTFETLVKRLGLRDRRVARIAQLVHEADLRDGKFPGEEVAGLDLSIRGLAAALPDDHQLLKAGMMLFDGLYAELGTRSSKKG